jgi:hypothetical protein
LVDRFQFIQNHDFHPSDRFSAASPSLR